MEDGFEKTTALSLRRGELRFELIEHRHQLVHLGDDAVLCGKRWRRTGILFVSAM